MVSSSLFSSSEEQGDDDDNVNNDRQNGNENEDDEVVVDKWRARRRRRRSISSSRSRRRRRRRRPMQLPSTLPNMSVVLCSSSTDIMLPGDTRTISIQTPPPLVESLFYRNEEQNYVAIGYVYSSDNRDSVVVVNDDDVYDTEEDDEEEEDYTVMQIATLCRVVAEWSYSHEGEEENDASWNIQLQAIGRIQLLQQPLHGDVDTDESTIVQRFDCKLLLDDAEAFGVHNNEHHDDDDNIRNNNSNNNNCNSCCCLIVDNIEKLVRKISRTERLYHNEQQLLLEDPDEADDGDDEDLCGDDEMVQRKGYDDGELWELYQDSLQQLSSLHEYVHVQGNDTAQTELDDDADDDIILASTPASMIDVDKMDQYEYIQCVSWAVFTAVKNYNNRLLKKKQSDGAKEKEKEASVLLDSDLVETYRTRALDWINLLERLKLAQYMLREIELRLQGRKLLDQLQLDSIDDDYSSMGTSSSSLLGDNLIHDGSNNTTTFQ